MADKYDEAAIVTLQVAAVRYATESEPIPKRAHGESIEDYVSRLSTKQRRRLAGLIEGLLKWRERKLSDGEA